MADPGAKPLVQSKTFWLNVGAFVVTYVLSHEALLREWGLDTQSTVAVLAVLNVINRFYTSQSVTLTKAS